MEDERGMDAVDAICFACASSAVVPCMLFLFSKTSFFIRAVFFILTVYAEQTHTFSSPTPRGVSLYVFSLSLSFCSCDAVLDDDDSQLHDCRENVNLSFFHEIHETFLIYHNK